MAGKKICVGAVGSGYEVAARQILGAYGMSYDDIDEQFADQATAKNGVQDGTLDGMFLCSGYPNSNVTELSLSGKIEVIDFIEDQKLDFHLANALKYICRAGKKNPDKTKEDLEKAVWYIKRYISHVLPE
jgi:TRAP-type uncharacterized transport system substrate-binding protein